MKSKPQQGSQDRVERLLFFISLAIVLGVVAALIWTEVAPGPRGSLVTAEVTQTEASGDRLTVHYTVSNRGDAAIQDVQIHIAAGEASVTQPLSHLPMGITRRGVAVLTDVPAGAKPEVRIESYLEP